MALSIEMIRSGHYTVTRNRYVKLSLAEVLSYGCLDLLLSSLC